MAYKMNINPQGEVFTDEIRTDVGTSAFKLYHDWFFDLVINTATGGGGTQLVLGTDYQLEIEDTYLSGVVSDELGESKNVWGKIKIINATYQTGDLYFSGKYVADSIEAMDINPPNVLIIEDEDYTIQDYDELDEIWMKPQTADRICYCPTLADNPARRLTIRNIGDGTYKVTVDGEGAETIKGAAEQYLYGEDEFIIIMAGPAEWKILYKSPIFSTEDPTTEGQNGDVWYKYAP